MSSCGARHRNKNILSSDINRSFDEMKRHVVDIDEKDMDKIHSFVEKYLTPKEYEKKAFGEVFTPLSLVREMLEAIPKYADAEFWKNPKLKILDPAAGIGNFPLIAFELLMDGLKRVIPDASKRKRHILENMLYMVELNPNNVRLMKKIFGGKNYKLNIIRGDFLKDETQEKMKKEWGVEKYDLVMGNPPFQPQSDGKKGGTSLWPMFVRMCHDDLLKNDAFLSFVHPALWRKPENDLRDIFYSSLLHRLSIRNTKHGQQMFKSGTRYDWYVLQKSPITKPTTITFEDDKTVVCKITSKIPFIPNYGMMIFKKVWKKLTNENGIKTIRDSYCHVSRPYVQKHQDKNHVYKQINSISKTHGTDIVYSSKPHPTQKKRKVIFSNGGVVMPMYDKGEFGTTEGGIYVLVDNSHIGKRLVQFLQSDLVKYLVKATKWSNFETSKQLFWYIPNIAAFTDIDMTNERINEYFGLASSEIRLLGKD